MNPARGGSLGAGGGSDRPPLGTVNSAGGSDRPPAAADASLPWVSVVIPARDCASLMDECLAAVRAQTYQGPLDITVALAPSTDGTEQVLERSLGRAAPARPLRVVDNPEGTTPAGLNTALAASRGVIVARVDAQARLPVDYIERCTAVLARTGAAAVGGVQRPVGGPGLPGAIAAALASPFGAGPAAFRRGRREGPVDTVYLGVYDRAALDAVGGFDETMKRNQDYELNWRLRAAGGTVWLDPAVIVDYVPRSDYTGLARQYFAYGAWKRRMLLRHPRSLRTRQLAAPALVAGLAVSAVGLAGSKWRGLAVPLVYAAACAATTARLSNALPRARDRFRAAAAFAVMHISWGAGFWAGRTAPRGSGSRSQPCPQVARPGADDAR